MAFLDRVIPALTIIVTTILVALPWGMAAENRFFLPLLPLIVIHYWTLRRPELVAEWWVFLAGLSVDILTNGPIGYWALIYLLGFAAAQLSTQLSGDGLLAKWGLSGVTLMGLTAIAWAVSSLYHFEFADWWPYASAAVAAALIYPVFGVVLRGLSLSRPQSRNALLKRGL